MVGQLCTLILLCFNETCCQGQLIKNFMMFYIVDLLFYVVRLYVMTKMDDGCLNE